MPKFVVKLNDKKTDKDYYILWSTIVDGAIRQFKGLEDATNYLKETHIPSECEISIKSLATQGVSNPFYSISDILDVNDENCETVEDLVEKYVEQS
jgi:hypothetical protein